MKRVLEVYDWYGSSWQPEPEPPPPTPPDDRHKSGEKQPLASKDPTILARVGIALGRFRPPHHGHLWFVEESFRRCGWLHLVSPQVVSHVDAAWLHGSAVRGAFAKYGSVVISPSPKNPSDPASWADIVRGLSPAPTHLFSCDPGAQRLADAAGLQHEIIDAGRTEHPIAATMIRDDLERYFHLIVPDVRSLFVLRVGIVGAEGSGKSTLSRELGAMLGAPIVEDSLLSAARGHGAVPTAAMFAETIHANKNRIDAAACNADNGVVINDDTPLLAGAWAKRLNIPLPNWETSTLPPSLGVTDLWLLCHNDFPYAGPRERDEPVGRRAFFEELRGMLRGRPNLFEVRGDGQERVEMAAAAVREWRTRHLKARAELLK